MNLVQTSQPAVLPVGVSDAKLQLSIDADDNDLHLQALIAAATEVVEIYIGRALMTRTYTGFLNWWPSSPRGILRSYVELEKPPLISITQVQTFDDSDVATVFDPSLYFVDAVRPLGRIVLRRGQVWPIPLRVANGIQIDWVAGLGTDPTLIPPSIRMAILMTVGALNENRGDADAPVAMSPTVQALLAPFLTWPPS